MASLALPAIDLFSIVTTADRRARSPGWKSLLDWPRHGDAHVDYAADTLAQRNLWAARLDEAVLRADKPVLLLASGESCFAAAWWARLSPASYVSRVAGALLFAPIGSGGQAEAEVPDKFASPRAALPFPSAIVDGAGSRRVLDRRIHALAAGWGSDFVEARRDAHDAGAWKHAQVMVMQLTARVVERELRVAGALGIRA